MSETKEGSKDLIIKGQKINYSIDNVIIRDSNSKLDTSAVDHGGTIVNSSDRKDTNKKK